MLQLSEKWGPPLTSQPETGMGYQIVSVFLVDGRRFDNVVVVGGTISQVPGYPNVPFVEVDIRSIVVTHGKATER